jgi:hypothetical protein
MTIEREQFGAILAGAGFHAATLQKSDVRSTIRVVVLLKVAHNTGWSSGAGGLSGGSSRGAAGLTSAINQLLCVAAAPSKNALQIAADQA